MRLINRPSTSQLRVGGVWVKMRRWDRQTGRYRNAWTDQDNKIVHDMSRAREIHKKVLRDAREPLLKALDVAWYKAQESGDVTAARVIAEQSKNSAM